jgi:hypothetical protein
VSARQESVDVACLSEEKLNMVSIQSAWRRIVALALHAQGKVQYFPSFLQSSLGACSASGDPMLTLEWAIGEAEYRNFWQRPGRGSRQQWAPRCRGLQL